MKMDLISRDQLPNLSEDHLIGHQEQTCGPKFGRQKAPHFQHSRRVEAKALQPLTNQDLIAQAGNRPHWSEATDFSTQPPTILQRH
jgi:hypothetical protein